MSKSFPFATNLLDWYDQQGRKDLPWREEITPYRVWVSEIMLQQTQVKTVIAYFERFITRFPQLADLANANQDEVLHSWTGLGYYSRARNLHQAAKKIQADYQGYFPSTLEELQSLPGIGRSTAGAILAIALQKKASILDGNVKRILTRFHTLAGITSQASVIQQLWAIAEQYTPSERTDDYTQAIMDLGATVCLRTKPRCQLCPVSGGCGAYLHNRQSEFPTPKLRKAIPARSVHFLLFYDQEHKKILLEKRPPVGVWGGLWSFPECALSMDIKQWSQEKLGLRVIAMQSLPAFKHVFSHFQLTITPVYINKFRNEEQVRDSSQYIWYKLDQPCARGFSRPVQRILQELTLKT